MTQRIAILFASVLGIGLISGAPGTYASVVTAAAYWWFALNHEVRPELHLSIVCLITLGGVFAAARVCRAEGVEDSQAVSVDEVAGQLLTFVFIPATAFNVAAGTVLFRVLDIWKPFPIRRLERLPNGVGVMADDLAAGVFANLLLHGLHWLLRQ